MKKQRILSALLTLCLVFSLVPTALAVGADNFTDVGRDSWCYDYVDYVTSEGYFLGTTNTTFSPDRNMTRAMFVVVLSRFDGLRASNGQSSFTDVEPGSWCAGAVEWAAENGIVTGYADGTFKPNASITRAQMCAIMDRYVDYYTAEHNVVVAQKGKSGTLTDQYQVPSYAAGAVRNCQKYGLINGYEDGTFRPQANSTRAHVAAIIYRLAFLIDGAKDADKYIVCPNCGELVSKNDPKCSNCGHTLGGGTHGSTTKPGSGGTSTPSTKYIYSLTFMDGDTKLAGPDASGKTTAKSYTFKNLAAYTTLRDKEDGMTFKGWSWTKGSQTVDVQKGATEVTLTSKKPAGILYAVWDPDDLVGKAVAATVADANSKYEKMKSAVISAVNDLYNDNEKYQTVITAEQFAAVKSAIQDMVTVGTVTYDQSGNPRTVSATVSASVTEDQTISAINAATDFAKKLLNNVEDDESVSTPSMGDVDSFIEKVKEIIKDMTGIDLTSERTEAIKSQVINKLMAEGKEEWANFYDEAGYYCGDITIEANGCTVVIKVDGANKSTMLDSITDMNGNTVAATKTNAVKYLGEAIAKDMLNQAKEQSNGEYIDSASMTGKVTVTFAKSETEDYADKQFDEDGTPIFPNVYEVSLTVDLDSDGLVSYKWDGSENYLKLTITKGIQETYNAVVNEAAAKYADDPEIKSSVVAEIQKMLTAEGENSLWKTIQSAVKNYGITLDESAKEDMIAALTGKKENEKSVVEQWVDTNWKQIVDSASSGKVENTNNSALTNALVSVMEKNIPTGDELDKTIQSLIDQQLYEMAYGEDGDPDWMLNAYNNNDMVKMAKQMVNSGLATVTPEVNFDVKSIEEIDNLVKEGRITIQTPLIENDVIVNIQTVVEMEAGNKLAAKMNESDTLKACLSDEDVKQYAIYSALVQAGLTSFENKKEESRYYVKVDETTGEDVIEDVMVPLRGSVVDVAKGKIPGIVEDKIEAVNVSDILALQDEYQDKIALFKSLKFSDNDGLQNQTFAGLAEKLRGETLQEIVGNEGDAFVEQYLAVYVGKLVNRLPAGASITINNDVMFDKSDLSAFSQADTTVDALAAAADVLEKLDDLSINSFDTDAGIPVQITYGARNFEFNLVIDVE